MPRSNRTPKQLHLEGLPAIHPNAAGIDIGADEIVVAVPPDRDPQPVRAFRTFTPDLHALVAWLVACRIDTVALESTGVYWIPIYELLEQHGIIPYLVNARHVKTVPGRKSDWNDAQWLQKLHALGLLHASFRPDGDIAALRTLVRYRAELIQHRAPHILHMQKAFQQMNLQLERVLSDIMGVTGQLIVRAIVAGERDGVVLAQHRNPACKSSAETIAKALTGTWKDELLFVLQQALVIYDVYTAQIAVCDTQIVQALAAMESRGAPDAPLPDLPPVKDGSKTKNAPPPETRAQYARLLGVDLVAVMGLSASRTKQVTCHQCGTVLIEQPGARLEWFFGRKLYRPHRQYIRENGVCHQCGAAVPVSVLPDDEVLAGLRRAKRWPDTLMPQGFAWHQQVFNLPPEEQSAPLPD